MAEFIMKQKVKERGIEKDFYIESAATSTEELGNPVYPPVRNILEKRGINCAQKRARQITRADYDRFDYIICMDSNNIRNLGRILHNDNENKIYKLLSFAKIDRDVVDPWYTRDFLKTEEDISIGCDALIHKIIGR